MSGGAAAGTAPFAGPGALIPQDLIPIVLLLALFVIPKVLQRFRLPGAITSLLLGVAAARFHLVGEAPVVDLLATFGIVAIFLFAGLEIVPEEMLRDSRTIGLHLALVACLAYAAAWISGPALGLDPRAGWLFALALFTPSTGFILSSLDGFGLDTMGRFWTKALGIGAEILALAALFFVLQSVTWKRLGLATLALLLLVVLIPAAMRLFAARVAVWAPRSEFAFLIILAVLCAQATRRLGVYYLVGAFLVGVAARRFRDRLPAMSSERMLHAVEAFASLFAPFYFFHAGMGVDTAALGPRAALLGVALLAVVLPLRVAIVALHQRYLVGQSRRDSLRVGLALAPTLVFTLVLADILRERFAAPPDLVGALILYTIGTTLLPGLVLKAPPPDYDAPHLAAAPRDAAPGGREETRPEG